MTWSPTATVVTPSPSASTTPAPSWPRTAGSGFGVAPVMTFQSLWQTPLADEAHAHLARARLGELDLLERQRAVDLAEHGGAHAAILGGARYARGMQMQAAVLWQPGRPVEILDVELAPPQEGEALVRIAACGVCASDLHVVDGDLPEPLPLVLGHEASGVVVETGPGVERRRAGRPRRARPRALLRRVRALPARTAQSFCELAARMAGPGRSPTGRARLSRRRHGRCTTSTAVSSFAEYAVVPESAAVPIRQGRAARRRGARRLRRAHRRRARS